MISCKSSPSGDSVSAQESELDSHCEHSPTRPKKNKLARREVHKLLQHSAPSRKCCCVSQSAVTAAMPSSLGSALCFKFNSLSLELVLVARQMQFNSINQIESQANPILQRACLVAASTPFDLLSSIRCPVSCQIEFQHIMLNGAEQESQLSSNSHTNTHMNIRACLCEQQFEYIPGVFPFDTITDDALAKADGRTRD